MANPSAPVNPSTVQSPTGYAPSLGQVPLYDPNAYMQPLMSNVADSMRMDNLAQQVALNRQMQGYGIGSGINDYLRDVYGDVLGVDFNTPDYSQFLQQNQGTTGTYTPGSVSMFSDYHNPNALNNLTPEQKAEYIPQNTAYLGNGYNAGAQMDPGLKGTMTNGSYINGGLGGPPSAEWIADQIAKHAGYSQDYKGPMDTTTPRPGFGLQGGLQMAQNGGGQAPPQQPQLQIQNGQYTAGQGPTALGKNMQRGTYTQTGNSFNPNQNSTWAKFLAPTFGKISQLSDAQMKQIQRQMPRGGEQDRAVSDAIAQKYGTMMGGWQSLVPQALSGLQQIGQSEYFQQPTFTGGMGTAAGMRSGDQNAALNEQQMQLQNQQFNQSLQQQKQQNKSGLFGLLGNALGAGVSALTGGLGGIAAGGLSSLLSGGNKGGGSTDYGIKTPLGSKPFGM